MGPLAAERHARLERGERGVLRAEHDLVDFALARREVAVGGNGARDVGGVAGVLAADVHQHDVAILNLGVELVEVQDRGMEAGAHDGRVGFALASAGGVDLDHLARRPDIRKAGMDHAHGGELRVDREFDGLGEQRDFAGRFDLAHGADGRRGIAQGQFRRGLVSQSDDSRACG